MHSALQAQPVATGQAYYGADIGLTGSTLLGQRNFIWDIEGSGSNKLLRTYLPFTGLGSGAGFVLGAKIGYPIYEKVDLEAKLRFLTTHTAKSQDFDNLILDPYHTDVLGQGTSDYSLTQSNISLALLGRYRLTNEFVAIAGFGISDNVANSFSSDQQLTGLQYPHYFRTDTHTNSNVDNLDRSGAVPVDAFATLRAEAQLGVGSTFRIGKDNMLLDVELLVSLPFTSWMSSAGKAHLDSVVANYLNVETPVAAQITYPHLWYATLTFGFRLPLTGSFPPPDHTPDPQPAPITITAVPTKDKEGNIILTGRVTNSKTGKPVVANVTTVDLNNNNVVSTSTTDSNGFYRVPVTGPGKYSVTANADGYLFGTALFEVDSQGRILKTHPDIKLSEAANGRTRLLVFFEVNKADLQPSSAPELNRAVELMKAMPSMEVEIAGYTDATGSAEYNKALAGRRANAVRDFLVQHGIPQNRVEARGYGEDSPIATNDTEEGRSENRRVEFVVRKW